MSQLSTLYSFMDLLARTDAPDYVNSRAAWINEAQRQICRMHRWWFTEHSETVTVTPSGGNGPYTLSVPMAFFNGVWISGGELQEVNLASVPLLPTQPQRPTHFRSGGIGGLSQLFVYPTPDASYSALVVGHRFLADLVGAADTNALVRMAPYALVFGAMVEAALHLGRDPSIWKARFDFEIKLLLEQDPKRGRPIG